MKKINLFVFLLFLAISSNAQEFPKSASTTLTENSKASKKKNTKNKTSAIVGQSYQRNLAIITEGFTSYPGGAYSIKDYRVKGTVNFICLSYGYSMGAGYINSASSAKKYYIQRSDDPNNYREIFLTKGFNNSILEISKAILTELMKDDNEVIKSIDKLTEITVSGLKKIVKKHNATHVETNAELH